MCHFSDKLGTPQMGMRSNSKEVHMKFTEHIPGECMLLGFIWETTMASLKKYRPAHQTARTTLHFFQLCVHLLESC